MMTPFIVHWLFFWHAVRTATHFQRSPGMTWRRSQNLPRHNMDLDFESRSLAHGWTIHPSLCTPSLPYIQLFIPPFVHPPILYIHPSVHPSIYLSPHLSIHPPYWKHPARRQANAAMVGTGVCVCVYVCVLMAWSLIHAPHGCRGMAWYCSACRMGKLCPGVAN